MSKRPLPTVRALTIAEWEAMVQRGEGGWVRFGIADVDGAFLIVERGGRLLAYLQHWAHESQAGWHVLNRLETRPHYGRRGYARQLVEQAISECGATLIIARGVSPSSVGFWQKLGFEPDGWGPEGEGNILYSEGNYIRKEDKAPAPRE